MGINTNRKLKKIYPIEEHCIGCRRCEVYCVAAHSESLDLIAAFKIEGLKGSNRNFVFERDEIAFSIQCRHCEEPHCVASCISGALFINEDGKVLYKEDQCVGCYSCVMACPYGVISMNKLKHKIFKCDLCEDFTQVSNGVPACVLGCPNEALIYAEPDDERILNVKKKLEEGDVL